MAHSIPLLPQSIAVDLAPAGLEGVTAHCKPFTYRTRAAAQSKVNAAEDDGVFADVFIAHVTRIDGLDVGGVAYDHSKPEHVEALMVAYPNAPAVVAMALFEATRVRERLEKNSDSPSV